MSAAGGRFLQTVALIALAALTALLVSLWTQHRGKATAGKGAEDDFHRWMHDQLAITPAQHEALAPVEKAFEEERSKLRAEITSAGKELADAVRQGKTGSPEIDAALARLNAAQAKLQRATLDHFFAMKDHLDPAQAEKLLQWTHDSILHQ
jgi:Spy/CpxP family protein refolding chaperone